jgi:glycosyltransferase involved in cell wall biosynthesis
VLDWLGAGTDHWQAILTLKSTPPDLTCSLKEAAAEFIEGDCLNRRILKYPTMFQTVRRTVTKLRPDVVICWTAGFGNWVSAGARAGGCRRLIVHAGNPTTNGFRGRWLTRYVVLPLAVVGAKLVCCSNYVRDTFRSIPGIPDSLVQTIYNCSQTERFAKASALSEYPVKVDSAKPFRAIMVATLENHKDHTTLLHAVSKVVQTQPNFKLTLVGDGSLRSQLVQLCKNLGLESTVDFLGTRNDVPELLAMSDLFVFSTTLQEGLGSVLLEALAARLPIIAGDVPACREILRGGQMGKLVPPASPEKLAEALTQAIYNRPDPSQIAKGAEYAASFTPQKMIREYLNLVGLS